MLDEVVRDLVQASRRRRIAGFIIDHFVMMFLTVGVALIVMPPDFMEGEQVGPLRLILALIPMFLLYVAKDTMNGVSLGKWVVGTMVRDHEFPHDVPSKGRLFARNLLYVVFPVEGIALLINEEKRRFGDRWQKTNVFKNPTRVALFPRVAVVLGIAMAFFACTAFFVGTTMTSSEPYKITLQAIEQDEEIREITGGIVGYGLMPSGGINVSNGEGRANFNVTVKGEQRDLEVFARLEKPRGGEWELIEFAK